MKRTLLLLTICLTTDFSSETTISVPPPSRSLYIPTEGDSFQAITTPVLNAKETQFQLNQSLLNARRVAEYQQIGTWFASLEDQLDDFRDNLNRKLSDLSFSLQKPKVPINSIGGMQLSPFANREPVIEGQNLQPQPVFYQKFQNPFEDAGLRHPDAGKELDAGSKFDSAEGDGIKLPGSADSKNIL